MALYKPSNFYPNMNEVDLEDENGAEFECKIHANGDEVNTRWFSTGGEDKALMIRQRHPSRGYSWREWAKVYQDLFDK